MSHAEPPPPIPGWADAERRKASSDLPSPGGKRTSAPHAQPASSTSVAWLDDAYKDLALNVAGHALTREAATRRRAGQDDTSWRTGADGESEVADALRRLTQPPRRRWLSKGPEAKPPWRVLHNIRVGAAAVADLDHVLIGPLGIAIVNTKKLDPRYPIKLLHGELHHGKYRTGFLASINKDVQLARALICSALDAIRLRTEHGSGPIVDLPDCVIDLSRIYPKLRAREPMWPTFVPALVFVGSGAVEEHSSLPILARPATFIRAVTGRPATLSSKQADALYELCRRSTTWSRDVEVK